jgi:hypothetical protein
MGRQVISHHATVVSADDDHSFQAQVLDQTGDILGHCGGITRGTGWQRRFATPAQVWHHDGMKAGQMSP